MLTIAAMAGPVNQQSLTDLYNRITEETSGRFTEGTANLEAINVTLLGEIARLNAEMGVLRENTEKAMNNMRTEFGIELDRRIKQAMSTSQCLGTRSGAC